MPSGSFFRRPAVLLALCLCSVGAVVTLLGRLATGPSVALKKVELVNEPGVKAYPAFSPNGARMAYSSRGTSAKDPVFHIFVRDIPTGEPRQLTTAPANDLSPAWSPDGNRLAFVRSSDDGVECVVISASEPGEERKYKGCATAGDEAQPLPAITWTRDGRSLVVLQAPPQQPTNLAVLSLDNGALQAITHPPAGADGDSTPAVSPDGNTLAFVRGTTSEGADLYLSDLSGANPRRLTFDDRAIRGISWTHDGQDLVYSGARVGGWKLWRVPTYGGSPRDFVMAGRNARYAAVAPAGDRLVYTVSPTVSSIWRATLGAKPGTPNTERGLIRSSGRETGAKFSPDGKKIANISDQTGHDEVWISDANGDNRVQVTHLEGPELARIRWSPDQKLLIFDADGDRGSELYTVAASANGKLVRAQLNAINGSFSNDGKSIYFQSRGQVWKAALDGGNPKQISERQGAGQPVESPDGKYLYYRNRRTFSRIPVAGGPEEEVIVPEHDLMWTTTMQLTRDGMYFLEFERSWRGMVVSFYNFTTKKNEMVYRMGSSDLNSSSFSVSPDGKEIIYPRIDQNQTNFVIIENFR